MAAANSRCFALTGGGFYTVDTSDSQSYPVVTFGAQTGMWNGTKSASNVNPNPWTAMGSSISGGTPRTRCVFPVSDTEVYVGGSFTSIGGVAANYIAMWNGFGYISLGSSIDGEVQTLVYEPVADRLYAGSLYSSVQRLYYCTLARTGGAVTGGTWSSDINAGHITSIKVLETDLNGNVYAAGSSTSGNGSFCKYNSYTGWAANILVSGTSTVQAGTIYDCRFNLTINKIIMCGSSKILMLYNPGDNTLSAMPTTVPAVLNTLLSLCIDQTGSLYISGSPSGTSSYPYQICKSVYSAGTWGTLSPIFTSESNGGFVALVADMNNNLYARASIGGVRKLYDYSTSTWFPGSDAVSNTWSFGGAVACILCGAEVLVLKNNRETRVPVEDLKEGDDLVLFQKTSEDRKTTKVLSTYSFIKTTCAESLPYCVPKDHFSPGCPYRDLHLSANHSVWHPEKGEWCHMNHSGFKQCTPEMFDAELRYFHVETEHYATDIIIVNGVPSETWDRYDLIARWKCDHKNHRCKRFLKM